MRRPAAMTGAIAGLLIMAGAASADGGPPLQPPKKTSEVIVRFRDQAAASTRAAARASVGSSSVRRLLLANTQVVRVEPGSARAASRELEQLDSVLWAEPNLPVKAGAAATDDPYFDLLWGLDNTGQTVEGAAGEPGVDVNALEAWDTTRGAGTVVAVVDSGVAADHPDIAPAIWTNAGEVPGNGVDDDGNASSTMCTAGTSGTRTTGPTTTTRTERTLPGRSPRPATTRPGSSAWHPRRRCCRCGS